MSNTRQVAHGLIDRLPETQLSGLVQFLETIIDPMAASIANAPPEDEEIGADEEQAVAEAREWRKHNEPIPHERVLADFGLTMADFERMGQTPLRRGPNGSGD